MASLRIFNSLTKTKQPLLKTNASSLLTFYVCGPTVYDSAHLGHGRTYILFDAMRRVLTKVLHKEVLFVMNITDIDDKILLKCKNTGQTRQELTSRFESEFFQDMKQLGVQRATLCPRATEYIPEMVSFIGRLMERGFAYRTADGSVYMDSVRANESIGYPGVLGKGQEVISEESSPSNTANAKRNASDFALWKASLEKENVWDCAPFGGMGRPGWHLECSAMIDATIGRVNGDGRLDIHGGGVDLCFPHHANERCQSELLLDKREAGPWSQFFCHTGHVTLQRDKMSKSTGNFITLQSLVGKEISARQLRLLFLSQKRYSAALEWSEGAVIRAKALDQQFNDFLSPKSNNKHQGGSTAATRLDILQDIRLGEELARARERVLDAMLDDFDFPKTFDTLQQVCKLFSNQESAFAGQARAFVQDTLETLGFGGPESNAGVLPAYGNQQQPLNGALPSVDDGFVDEVVAFRAQVRNAAKSKDLGAVLTACDKFRNATPGSIVIQDLRDGTSTWKRKV